MLTVHNNMNYTHYTVVNCTEPCMMHTAHYFYFLKPLLLYYWLTQDTGTIKNEIYSSQHCTFASGLLSFDICTLYLLHPIVQNYRNFGTFWYLRHMEPPGLLQNVSAFIRWKLIKMQIHSPTPPKYPWTVSSGHSRKGPSHPKTLSYLPGKA